MKKITLMMLCLLAGFAVQAQYASMAIVGDGVGGWPTGADGEVDVHQMTTNDGGVTWTIENLVTQVGSVKFRAENSWANNWGGAGFPSGTAVPDSSTNIGTQVGVYNVTFDTGTLTYSFDSAGAFPVISLTGTGIEGLDWGIDVDLATTDGVTYTATDLHLIDGALKFRQNHDWTVNWGEDSFPAGTGVQDGPGITIPGTSLHAVSFNRETGEYVFSIASIAIVGDATPQGWPADPQTDLHVFETADGITYTLASITLVDGGAKFRQNNAWAKNWGAAAFPTGTATQDGPNFPVVAGTYAISFNKLTGEYTFGDTAGTDVFGAIAIRVYPNPAAEQWTIELPGSTIDGIEITDMLGKTVLPAKGSGNLAIVNAATLKNGIYVARISAAGALQTVKLVKN